MKCTKIIQHHRKEYMTLLIALFLQSYFGYRLIKIISLISHYSGIINDNMFQIVLSCLGFVAGSAIILFIAYLYLKRKIENPIRKLLKYALLYAVIEIIIAVIIGVLTTCMSIDITRRIGIVIQYFFRYFFIIVIFMRIENIRIGSVKRRLWLGVVITLTSIVLTSLIKDSVINVILEVIYCMTILGILTVINYEKELGNQ